MPSEYIRYTRVSFADGDIWNIDMSENEYSSISELIEAISEESDEDITRLDFQINIDKVKHDVTRETELFFSKS